MHSPQHIQACDWNIYMCTRALMKEVREGSVGEGGCVWAAPPTQEHASVACALLVDRDADSTERAVTGNAVVCTHTGSAAAAAVLVSASRAASANTMDWCRDGQWGGRGGDVTAIWASTLGRRLPRPRESTMVTEAPKGCMHMQPPSRQSATLLPN